MRVLFTIYRCPHCKKAKFGVLKANLHLPVGKMIDMVEIMNGDPRVNAVREAIGEVVTPVLILDKTYSGRVMNSYVKSRFRHVFVSSFGNKSTETIIKDLLYEEVI